MPKKPVAVSLRKPPPAVDPDLFVKAEERPAPSAAPKPLITSPDPIVKHGAREYREMTLYLATDVARELSFFCMDKNRDLNGVVGEAVTRYVSQTAAEPAAAPEPAAPTPVLVTIAELSRNSLRALWSLRPWAI